MKWPSIVGVNRQQPASGSYSDWKPKIAATCSHRCIYCGITEGRFGGERNFHVEHYRPKSRFASLENKIENLFYACAICNTFKGSDWPGEPCKENSRPCYPDPTVCDYNYIFVITERGIVHGLHPSSKYVESRVFLNRPQLILERRISSFMDWAGPFQQALVELAQKLAESPRTEESARLLVRIVSAMGELSRQTSLILTGRPYTASDVSRNGGRTAVELTRGEHASMLREITLGQLADAAGGKPNKRGKAKGQNAPKPAHGKPGKVNTRTQAGREA